jgi:hypothetical protein
MKKLSVSRTFCLLIILAACLFAAVVRPVSAGCICANGDDPDCTICGYNESGQTGEDPQEPPEPYETEKCDDVNCATCTVCLGCCRNGVQVFTNKTCSEIARTYGQDGLFYKVSLNAVPPQPYISEVENDFINDPIAKCIPAYDYFMIGILSNLLIFPDSGIASYMSKCNGQHRAFGYIYIPEGWYDFGFAANQSTTDPDGCYYCKDGRGLCDGNNHGGENEHDLQYCTGHGDDRTCTWYTCWDYFKIFYRQATPQKSLTQFLNDHPTCKLDCGGNMFGWIGAEGSGSSSSHYVSPSFASGVSYDLEDRFENLTTRGLWKAITPLRADYLNEANPVDTVWTGRKYFTQGWYPVQFSFNWGTYDTLLNPKLVWRKCLSETGACQGTVYYAKGDINGGDVYACQPGPSSCTLNWGVSNLTLSPGDSANVTIIVNGAILDDKVYLTSSSPSNLSVPEFCTVIGNSCQFTVTAPSSAQIGTYTISASATHEDGTTTCTAQGGGSVPSLPVTIESDDDWWQVVDMDLFTSGKLKSIVPENKYFELDGAGGFPGIPVYADTEDIPSGRISQGEGWIVNSNYSSKYTTYNYSFFERMTADTSFNTLNNYINWLPAGEADKKGIKWYKGDGEPGSLYTLASSGNIVLGNQEKVVILLDGDLNIRNNIQVDSSRSAFLMFVVNGDINIDQGVTRIEGIYYATGEFKTGAGNATLAVNGSVVAMQGVKLQRVLPSAQKVNPAEVFTYRPDLMLFIPPVFASTRVEWREVAP